MHGCARVDLRVRPAPRRGGEVASVGGWPPAPRPQLAAESRGSLGTAPAMPQDTPLPTPPPQLLPCFWGSPSDAIPRRYRSHGEIVICSSARRAEAQRGAAAPGRLAEADRVVEHVVCSLIGHLLAVQLNLLEKGDVRVRVVAADRRGRRWRPAVAAAPHHGHVLVQPAVDDQIVGQPDGVWGGSGWATRPCAGCAELCAGSVRALRAGRCAACVATPLATRAPQCGRPGGR